MITGLEILFTDNLSDHLRIYDNKKLYVFYQASFLKTFSERQERTCDICQLAR